MVMKKIWKYSLPMEKAFDLDLPKGAIILKAECQYTGPRPQDGLVPCLWALLDPDAPTEKREFMIIGTGWEIENPYNLIHIDTFQQGPLVWHLFEVNL
jgi:hypothetical protein